eukprot:340513-Pelagomonas_calceolata.AAC.3
MGWAEGSRSCGECCRAVLLSTAPLFQDHHKSRAKIAMTQREAADREAKLVKWSISTFALFCLQGQDHNDTAAKITMTQREAAEREAKLNSAEAQAAAAKSKLAAYNKALQEHSQVQAGLLPMKQRAAGGVLLVCIVALSASLHQGEFRQIALASAPAAAQCRECAADLQCLAWGSARITTL